MVIGKSTRPEQSPPFSRGGLPLGFNDILCQCESLWYWYHSYEGSVSDPIFFFPKALSAPPLPLLFPQPLTVSKRTIYTVQAASVTCFRPTLWFRTSKRQHVTPTLRVRSIDKVRTSFVETPSRLRTRRLRPTRPTSRLRGRKHGTKTETLPYRLTIYSYSYQLEAMNGIEAIPKSPMRERKLVRDVALICREFDDRTRGRECRGRGLGPRSTK